jgi:hypothetical protein
MESGKQRNETVSAAEAKFPMLPMRPAAILVATICYASAMFLALHHSLVPGFLTVGLTDPFG